MGRPLRNMTKQTTARTIVFRFCSFSGHKSVTLVTTVWTMVICEPKPRVINIRKKITDQT